MRLPWSAQPAFPALAVSSVILADALAARSLLRADEERVFVLGRPIEWVCALRARYGLPCPTCGLTRSVVMSVHGEFARAWRVAPVGPVLVVGAVAFAVVMLVLATSRQEARSAAHAWVRKGAAVYAVGALAVWLAGWAVSFESALAER